MFKIFICVMLYFFEDFHYANYFNDVTGYSEDKSTGFIVSDLKQWSSIIFISLHNNSIKGKTDKNHSLVSSSFKDTIKIDSD